MKRHEEVEVAYFFIEAIEPGANYAVALSGVWAPGYVSV